MVDSSESIEASGAEVVFVDDAASGLRAIIAIDDERLGPAAGGIRTRAYAQETDAVGEVLSLARSMTIKCALAGLDAGGGKCVVLDHPALDRPAAFAALGDAVDALGGRFQTAGDLGTTNDDLRAARAKSPFVHVDDGDLQLAAAVGQTVLAGVWAALALPDGASLDGVRVGVQGVGAIGGAVARALGGAGAKLILSDLDHDRARALAEELSAEVSTSPMTAWEVDVLSPCAVGGVIGVDEASAMRARVVVGGANGILRPDELTGVGSVFRRRDITFVPDVLSSSGAVIAGIAKTVMHVDPAPLLAAVTRTTRCVLARSWEAQTSTWEEALSLAHERLDAAGPR